MSECTDNPDMQGIGLMSQVFVTNVLGGAQLLWSTGQNVELEMAVQTFPILIGTLLSIKRNQLTLTDARFALTATQSPTTLLLAFKSASRLLLCLRSRKKPRGTLDFLFLICALLWLTLAPFLVIPGIWICSEPNDDVDYGGIHVGTVAWFRGWVISALIGLTFIIPIANINYPPVYIATPVALLCFLGFARANYKYRMIERPKQKHPHLINFPLFTCFTFLTFESYFYAPGANVGIALFIVFLTVGGDDGRGSGNWISKLWGRMVRRMRRPERAYSALIGSYVVWSTKLLGDYSFPDGGLSYGQWLALCAMIGSVWNFIKLVRTRKYTVWAAGRRFLAVSRGYLEHPLQRFTHPLPGKRDSTIPLILPLPSLAEPSKYPRLPIPRRTMDLQIAEEGTLLPEICGQSSTTVAVGISRTSDQA
ncbi:hypothetical protein DL96DRAFT_1613683 [Flagelloscypha sp. PMI_526]|nr:hypothetical protein DL96DRAFT_1613683 [Flagelloscypha sp. PMI_526]